MKKHLLILIGLFFSLSGFSQPSDSLIRKGVSLQQRGEYSQAIRYYQEVLRQHPDHSQAHYELALSFFSLKDYDSSLEHSEQALAGPVSPIHKGAYLVKGSSLDNLGRPEAARQVYQEGIRIFPDNYLLYYNLGLSHFNSQGFEDAALAIEQALRINPNHASSHLLMAHTMVKLNHRVHAVLAAYYFLMLEPESSRAPTTLAMLHSLMKMDVKTSRNQEVTIDLKRANSQDDFAQAELMLTTLGATHNLSQNKLKTASELFAEHTRAFFSVLGNEQAGDFWHDMYANFFGAMANRGHAQAFAYHVSRSSSDYQVKAVDTRPRLKPCRPW
jgi:tetratricopeptide (TPR) repeat protein